MARAMELCASQWKVVEFASNGLSSRERVIVPPPWVDVTSFDQVSNWVQRKSEQAGQAVTLKIVRVGVGPDAFYKGGRKIA